jgi:hypothetical protein
MQNHATTPEDCANPQAKSDPAANDSLYLYISTVNPNLDPSQDEFFQRNINEIGGWHIPVTCTIPIIAMKNDINSDSRSSETLTIARAFSAPLHSVKTPVLLWERVVF